MWQAVDVRDVVTNFYCEVDNWRRCYWWVKASLCSIYDQDFFKFKPSNLSSITIRSAGDTDTYGGYTHIWNDGTWDFDGDDNSGDGLNFEIHVKYRVEPDEWVYIHVVPTGYHTDHDYVLIVEVNRLD
jgi:hypothetical protein